MRARSARPRRRSPARVPLDPDVRRASRSPSVPTMTCWRAWSRPRRRRPASSTTSPQRSAARGSLEPPRRHVQRDRLARPHARVVGFVPGREPDPRRPVAMRERDAGVRRRAERRRDAGHDLERMPASASSSASSPPRPKTNGSPDFRRTTVRPARARSSTAGWSRYVALPWPRRRPTATRSASGGASARIASVTELVVGDDLGAARNSRARTVSSPDRPDPRRRDRRTRSSARRPL